MPIKERRTKILLLLILNSSGSNVDAGVQFDFVPLTNTLQQIFDVSLNQKTKGTLSSLMREGLIEKKMDEETEKPDNAAVEKAIQANVSQYRLTKKGLLALCLEFPFFRFHYIDWDGLWRVISYEIPEKRRKIRDRLRREMRGWGLGPWHRSFWITPHPIITDLRDLVYGREEEQYVQAFEATHVFGQREVLVEKVWKKGELDKKYRDLFRQWHVILSKEEANEDKFKEIVALYVHILRADPGLPTSLMGKKWIGFESYDIFREVRGILLR